MKKLITLFLTLFIIVINTTSCSTNGNANERQSQTITSTAIPESSSTESLNNIKKENIPANEAIDDINKYVGVYKYEYEHNTDKLTEDHYIVIEKVNDKLAGRYYGTTDDFDTAREGYYPGFFVSRMNDLQISNDIINFNIGLHENEIFSLPVDLKYKTSMDVPLERNSLWINNHIFKDPGINHKDYKGTIINDEIQVNADFGSRVFKKLESINEKSAENGDLADLDEEESNTLDLKNLLKVELSGKGVSITINQNPISYTLSIPERIEKAAQKYIKNDDLFIFKKLSLNTFNIGIEKNQVDDLYSLRLKYGEVEYISGEVESKYVDIAKILLLNPASNKLEREEVEILPKYVDENALEGFKLSEAVFGKACLFATFDSFLELAGTDKEEYKGDIEGNLVIDNLDISFTNYRISGIKIVTADYETARGLKVGDDKIKAKMLYGLPDIGYFEDNEWVYCFYRDWLNDGSSDILSEDCFKIVFEENIVKSIELEGYIPYD